MNPNKPVDIARTPAAADVGRIKIGVAILAAVLSLLGSQALAHGHGLRVSSPTQSIS